VAAGAGGRGVDGWWIDRTDEGDSFCSLSLGEGIDEAAREHEPQAGPPPGLRLGPVAAGPGRPEQIFDALGGHARAGVAHAEAERSGGVGDDLDGHLAEVRELHAVREQAGQHTAQARRIADHDLGDVGAHGRADLEPLARGQRQQQRHRLLHAGAQVEALRSEVDEAALHLREIEQLAHAREKIVGARANGLDHGELLARERRAQELVGGAEHAVQGRADLVAHAGGEQGLRADRLFRGLHGAQQLFLGALALAHIGADADEAHDLARRVALRRHAQQHGHARAVFAQVRPLLLVGGAADGLGHERLEARGHVDAQLLGERSGAGHHLGRVVKDAGVELADQLLGAVAERRLEHAVDEGHAADAIGRDHQRVHAVEHAAGEPGGGGLLGFHGRRDHLRERSQRRAVAGAEEGEGERRRDQGSVALVNADLAARAHRGDVAVEPRSAGDSGRRQANSHSPQRLHGGLAEGREKPAVGRLKLTVRGKERQAVRRPREEGFVSEVLRRKLRHSGAHYA
jgi:hypothetical protein